MCSFKVFYTCAWYPRSQILEFTVQILFPPPGSPRGGAKNLWPPLDLFLYTPLTTCTVQYDVEYRNEVDCYQNTPWNVIALVISVKNLRRKKRVVRLVTEEMEPRMFRYLQVKINAWNSYWKLKKFLFCCKLRNGFFKELQ